MLAATISYCIIALFAAWAAITVLNQFSPGYYRRRPRLKGARLIRWVKNLDHFSMVPIWTFFAPTPGTRDHDVMYRDQLVDGTLTPWHSICDNSTGWECVLWNPRKRLKKAILDMAHSLLRNAYRITRSKGKRNPKFMLVSLPYIGLATRVSSFDRGPLSVKTQFVIAISNGYRTEKDPEVLYLSPFFELK